MQYVVDCWQSSTTCFAPPHQEAHAHIHPMPTCAHRQHAVEPTPTLTVITIEQLNTQTGAHRLTDPVRSFLDQLINGYCVQ